MVSTHLLSHFLSNLQNHYKSKKIKMVFYQTKIINQLILLLIKEGFIRGFKILPDRKLLIFLKYDPTYNLIDKITIFSKPGKRVYIKNSWIFKQKKSTKLIIISTPLGLMTLTQAKQLNCGGELICQIN